MKLIILTTLIAVAASAQLPSTSYLPQNSGPQSPSNSYLPGRQGGSGGGFQNGGFGGLGGNGNTRAQQEFEKNAEILKLDQDINGNGFHYSYETSNGIRAEESGNEQQTQGGFSYKGDDGNTYSIVFTAGEGGFRPQGDHLPVAPPTPEAILQALEQNAKDEAAGIFDDGKYKPDASDNGNARGPGSSSSGQGYGSSGQGYGSSGSSFGSANHQGSFNGQSGYRY